MKAKILFIFILMFTGLILAQDEIPLVTLQEINQVPDTLTTWVNSPLTGQLVRVRGQVSVRPIISDEGNRNPVLSFGTHWGCYIQGPNNEPWGGLNIYAGDSASIGTQLTTFDLSDTAKTYEFTGLVTMYGQTTRTGSERFSIGGTDIRRR